MRTHIIMLEAFEDESTGEIGLGLLNMPRDETTNAAHDGLIIAHDIIEHINGSERIGTIEDELEVLGAIWYVRGQYGVLRQDNIDSSYTVVQNMASDITRMYRDYINGIDFNSHIKRTLACIADDSINEILAHASKDYIKEFDKEDGEYDTAIRYWPAYRTQCLHLMRTGYRKAYNKWEHVGQYAANNQFWAIADAVNPYAKSAEYEGQQFKLTYGNGKAYCEEVYNE